MAELFDISLVLAPGIEVYPGDPIFEMEKIVAIEKGHAFNLSKLKMGTHLGTHIDAPAHFFAGGKTVEQIELHRLIGPARIVHIPHENCIVPADFAGALDQYCTRVLFAARRDGPAFPRPASYLSAEAAEMLARRGMLLVGVDGMSVDAPNSDAYPAHLALLSREIVIIENVDLRAVPPGDYMLYCLPLSIRGADGAPARAVLQSREPAKP